MLASVAAPCPRPGSHAEEELRQRLAVRMFVQHQSPPEDTWDGPGGIIAKIASRLHLEKRADIRPIRRAIQRHVSETHQGADPAPEILDADARAAMVCFRRPSAQGEASSSEARVPVKSCEPFWRHRIDAPKVKSRRDAFRGGIANASAAGWAHPTRANRRVWDLIVFGFELRMLELHLETLAPEVDGFLVSEASVCFQTGRPKRPLLTDALAAKTIDRTISPKVSVRVLSAADARARCKGEGLRKYSSRCFQAVQRHVSLEMLLRVAAEDDLALVADVDEIARPHIVRQMAACVPHAPGPLRQVYGLSARQYKFGAHCDTGYVWEEGPKIYSVGWLNSSQAWSPKGFDSMRPAGRWSMPYVSEAAWHLTSFGSTEQVGAPPPAAALRPRARAAAAAHQAHLVRRRRPLYR